MQTNRAPLSGIYNLPTRAPEAGSYRLEKGGQLFEKWGHVSDTPTTGVCSNSLVTPA